MANWKSPSSMNRLSDTLFIIFLLSLIGTASLRAGEPPIKTDSREITVRYPSTKTITRYRQDPDFSYHTIPPTPTSPWQHITRWIVQRLYNFFSQRRYSPYRTFLSYLLIILTLALVIRILSKSGIGGVFRAKSPRAPNQFNAETEEVDQLNLQKLIDDAIARKQYRLAVRFFYLKMLRQLSENQLIVFQTDKTNRDYLNEIESPELRDEFRDITRLFEYIWYGEFPIDEPLFHLASEKIQRFQNQIEPTS